MATKKLEVVIAGDAKGAQGAFGAVEKEAEGLGPKLQGIGQKLNKVMLGVGIAAGAALALGFREALNDDLIVADFSADLGVSPEVAEEMGAATSAAWARGFGENKAEVVEAAKAVNTAFGDEIDYDSEALQPLIEQAHALTEVFGVDLNEAMMAAGTMLRNGLVADGQEAMDLLAAGLKGLAPAVRDEILAATNEYSKHFAALGISGEEAIRLFRASDGVIGVDKMGDALKELTIRGTDMSKTMEDAYTSIGLDSDAMAEKLLAGGSTARGAMDEIVAALLDVDQPARQAEVAVALFGTPLEDLGTDQIPAFLGSLQKMNGGLGDTEGAAQELADSLTEGPMAAIERFRRQALQKLADFIGNRVIPIIEDVVGWFSENRWAIGPLAAAIGSVLVGAFILWAAAALPAAAATLAATWPVIALVAAVAALAAGLTWAYQNVDWFRDAVDKVASFLTDTVWPILQDVAGYLLAGFSVAWQWASGAVGWLVQKGTELWNFFQANILPILETVGSVLMGAFSTAWGVGRDAVGWVVTKATELWGYFNENVLPILKTVAEHLEGAFSTAFEVGRGAVEKVVEIGSDLWTTLNEDVWPILKTVAEYLEGAFTTGFNIGKGAIEGLKGVADRLVETLQGIIDKAKSAVDAIKKIPGAGMLGSIAGAVIPGLASGGPAPVGTPYWVGERGPELRIDTKPGYIVPNHKVGNYVGGGGRAAVGGGDTYISIHVEGSVTSEGQLVDKIHDGLIRRERQRTVVGV